MFIQSCQSHHKYIQSANYRGNLTKCFVFNVFKIGASGDKRQIVFIKLLTDIMNELSF